MKTSESNVNIVDIGKYYLYRYTRIDKNEVFYIGIGTKHSDVFYTEKQEYRRAYNINSRGNYFKNIINKTGYVLDIILESDDHTFIKNKEIEFIKLYGLKNNGGTLCNLSIGGESSSGVPISDSHRRILRNRMSRSLNPQSKKVINIRTGIIYGSVIEASNYYSYSYDNLLSKLSGKKRNNSNFIYLEEYKKGKRPEKTKNLSKRKIIDLESGKIFESLRECAKFFSKHPSYICNILKRKIKPKKQKINIDYYDPKKETKIAA